jgi:hypothetical protein
MGSHLADISNNCWSIPATTRVRLRVLTSASWWVNLSLSLSRPGRLTKQTVYIYIYIYSSNLSLATRFTPRADGRTHTHTLRRDESDVENEYVDCLLSLDEPWFISVCTCLFCVCLLHKNFYSELAVSTMGLALKFNEWTALMDNLPDIIISYFNDFSTIL